MLYSMANGVVNTSTNSCVYHTEIVRGRCFRIMASGWTSVSPYLHQLQFIPYFKDIETRLKRVTEGNSEIMGK